MTNTSSNTESYLRSISAAICFTVFGVLGVLVGWTLFPLIFILSPDKQIRRLRAQKMIHYLFKGFMLVLQKTGVLSFSVDGELSDLPKGSLVIANHPTLVDVVALISLMPQADCVVKRKVWNNPCMMMSVRTAGYIVNDEPESLIDQCVASLQAGRNLIIFPEGTRTDTRTKDLLINKLQRGVGNIGARVDCEVKPVVIRCVPPFLSKRHPWYYSPRSKPHLYIDIKQGVSIGQLTHGCEGKGEAIKARKITTDIADYYLQELKQ